MMILTGIEVINDEIFFDLAENIVDVNFVTY